MWLKTQHNLSLHFGLTIENWQKQQQQKYRKEKEEYAQRLFT